MRTKTLAQAEKILAAAARLFATQRFHEARMEDIAAAAEVGKGTLYRYFKDKDELYDALLVRAGEQLSRRLAEEMAQAAGARAREFYDEQARKRMTAGGGDKRSDKAKPGPVNLPDPIPEPGQARDKVGKAAGRGRPNRGQVNLPDPYPDPIKGAARVLNRV